MQVQRIGACTSKRCGHVAPNIAAPAAVLAQGRSGERIAYAHLCFHGSGTRFPPWLWYRVAH
eukprot:901901-Alexandrium_andersonii.AAC.1